MVKYFSLLRAVFCLLVVGLTVTAHNSYAQNNDLPDQDDIRNHPWYVFLRRSVDSAGTDQLIFVDVLTGEQTSLDVFGERYTPSGRSVIFYDVSRRRVMLALPDGSVREHPFIQPNLETRRVDWVVSADGSRIAWTMTNDDGRGGLTTITTVANSDGTNAQQLLVDGPRADGLRALPLAFDDTHDYLYLDFHPDGLSNFMPILQYAGLARLNLQTREVAPLPGEVEYGCLCGAGLGAGLFLRLGLSSTQSGFDLRVYNLQANIVNTISPLTLRDYTLAGNVLIAPDGSRAVYALARISSFGTPQQSIQTVFVMVDLNTMTQTTLTNPITTFVRPVEWTEDNTAVLFTSPNQNGTWKINLRDGRLERVAEAAYLGTLLPLGR